MINQSPQPIVIPYMFKFGIRPCIANEIKPLTSLRGLAAILVILCHLPVPAFVAQQHPSIRAMFEFGWMGVPIYFVLSGYLITQLALQEKEKYQQLSLKFFFMRRILRVWPIYFLFCALGLWAWKLPSVREIAASPQYFIPFLTFTTNVAMVKDIGQVGLLGALWTIALDEQFYLFWGICLKYLARKELIQVGIVCFFLCLMWRMFPLPFSTFIMYRIQLPVSLCTIMEGCLLAFIMPTLLRHKKIQLLFIAGVFIGSLALILWEWPFPGSVAGCFYLIGAADWIAVALVVVCCGENRITKLLNNRVLYFFGDISLAMYMSNLFVIYFYFRYCSWAWLFPKNVAGIWGDFALNSLSVFLIVCGVSYLWHRLDKPLLDARKLFRTNRTLTSDEFILSPSPQQ